MPDIIWVIIIAFVVGWLLKVILLGLGVKPYAVREAERLEYEHKLARARLLDARDELNQSKRRKARAMQKAKDLQALQRALHNAKTPEEKQCLHEMYNEVYGEWTI